MTVDSRAFEQAVLAKAIARMGESDAQWAEYIQQVQRSDHDSLRRGCMTVLRTILAAPVLAYLGSGLWANGNLIDGGLLLFTVWLCALSVHNAWEIASPFNAGAFAMLPISERERLRIVAKTRFGKAPLFTLALLSFAYGGIAILAGVKGARSLALIPLVLLQWPAMIALSVVLLWAAPRRAMSKLLIVCSLGSLAAAVAAYTLPNPAIQPAAQTLNHFLAKLPAGSIHETIREAVVLGNNRGWLSLIPLAIWLAAVPLFWILLDRRARPDLYAGALDEKEDERDSSIHDRQTIPAHEIADIYEHVSSAANAPLERMERSLRERLGAQDLSSAPSWSESGGWERLVGRCLSPRERDIADYLGYRSVSSAVCLKIVLAIAAIAALVALIAPGRVGMTFVELVVIAQFFVVICTPICPPEEVGPGGAIFTCSCFVPVAAPEPGLVMTKLAIFEWIGMSALAVLTGGALGSILSRPLDGVIVALTVSYVALMLVPLFVALGLVRGTKLTSRGWPWLTPSVICASVILFAIRIALEEPLSPPLGLIAIMAPMSVVFWAIHRRLYSRYADWQIRARDM